MKTSSRLAVVAFAFLAASSVHAAAVGFAGRASFAATYPGASIENWDSYPAATTIVNGTTLGGITYNSSSGNSFVTSAYLASTPSNGLGNTANPTTPSVDEPLGYFAGNDSITFSFGAALSAFAIDFNTFSAAPGAFTLTTNTGEVITSVLDPFGSASPGPGFPSQPVGQFAGFSSNIAFTSVTVRSPIQEVYTLDTLRFVTATVASPAPDGGLSIVLFGSACAALLAFRRKLA